MSEYEIEMPPMMTVPLTNVQEKKIQFLMQKQEALPIAADVFLDSLNGKCKVDTFGRVTWLNDSLVCEEL